MSPQKRYAVYLQDGAAPETFLMYGHRIEMEPGWLVIRETDYNKIIFACPTVNVKKIGVIWE